ncbi:hypothetical protein SEVIR_2G025301v4 [Setaria viridis]
MVDGASLSTGPAGGECGPMVGRLAGKRRDPCLGQLPGAARGGARDSAGRPASRGAGGRLPDAAQHRSPCLGQLPGAAWGGAPCLGSPAQSFFDGGAPSCCSGSRT